MKIHWNTDKYKNKEIILREINSGSILGFIKVSNLVYSYIPENYKKNETVCKIIILGSASKVKSDYFRIILRRSEFLIISV